MSTKEGKIQKEILDYLKSKGIFHWRQNNGAVYDPKINGYRSHTGMRGVPDILLILDGRFIGIEVKTPKGRQSPDQILFQRRCERHGGLYILARSVDDTKKALLDAGLLLDEST